MKSWVAKFFGGPLEGTVMQVDTKVVAHMVTGIDQPKIRTYWYRRKKQLGPGTWSYTVDEITEKDKFRR